MFTNLSDLQKSGFFIALVLMIASLFGVLKITPEVYMFAPMIALVSMFLSSLVMAIERKSGVRWVCTEQVKGYGYFVY